MEEKKAEIKKIIEKTGWKITKLCKKELLIEKDAGYGSKFLFNPRGDNFDGLIVQLQKFDFTIKISKAQEMTLKDLMLSNLRSYGRTNLFSR